MTSPDIATVRAFDYSAISADLIADARAAADRIRTRNRDAYAAAVDIGHELIGIRDRLEHGLFLTWVEAECGFSKTTAYRFIDVAERLPDELPNLGSLPLSVTYKVAARSTPEPVRQEIVRRLEAGEDLPALVVEDLISKAKEEERRAKADAKLTEEQRQKKARKAKRERRSREQWEAEWQREKEERKTERLKQFTAAQIAAALVIQKLDGDIDRLVSLLLDADDKDFVNLIVHAADKEKERNWKAHLLSWHGIDVDQHMAEGSE